MSSRRTGLLWLAMLLALQGRPALARGDEPGKGVQQPVLFPVRPDTTHNFPAPALPLDQVHPLVRDAVRRVIDQPTLTARGPVEVFQGEPHAYHWLLDHPDLTAQLWQVLGARTTPIEGRGPDQFGFRDSNGSDVHWFPVLRSPGLHVWYAEGLVKPGLVLPKAAVQAVVVVAYQPYRNEQGRPCIRHQHHLLLHTDSKAVALAARILGASAPRLAEQYMGQLQMFFGGLAWYLQQDGERTARMFRSIRQPLPPGFQPAEPADQAGPRLEP